MSAKAWHRFIFLDALEKNKAELRKVHQNYVTIWNAKKDLLNFAVHVCVCTCMCPCAIAWHVLFACTCFFLLVRLTFFVCKATSQKPPDFERNKANTKEVSSTLASFLHWKLDQELYVNWSTGLLSNLGIDHQDTKEMPWMSSSYHSCYVPLWKFWTELLNHRAWLPLVFLLLQPTNVLCCCS